ncbi:epoxide hydrolase family protein [Streptomyces sp. enrichment culture]|uniref:epoxide hydrolase family protein n=1 Tax=Streptomyces sp. enrichment culture TaxID=1795815 RepID=UPI003F56006F
MNIGNRSPERFTIDVAQDVLDDLAARLKATRFFDDLDNEDEYYGVSTKYIKPLVEYWADGFDWRAAEKRLNSFDQFKIEIDDTPVHFVRKAGKGPNPTPLLILHGWPWPGEFSYPLLEPLTDPAAHGGDPADAFDVIMPTLPGFAWSTPVTRGDLNYWKIADILHRLMTEVLGYERFGALGTDYGALVNSALGHKYGDSIIALHYGHDLPPGMFQHDRYWDLTAGQPIPQDASPELRSDIMKFHSTYASHVAVHMLDASTLSHGLNDSPIGMLAWLLQRWKKWSDKNNDFDAVFSRDFVLTQATVFWVTQSIGSSIRMYRNAVRHPWTPSHDRQPTVEPPAGFTFLLGDVSPWHTHHRRAHRRLRERPHPRRVQRRQRQRSSQGRPLRPLRKPGSLCRGSPRHLPQGSQSTPDHPRGQAVTAPTERDGHLAAHKGGRAGRSGREKRARYSIMTSRNRNDGVVANQAAELRMRLDERKRPDEGCRSVPVR